MKSSKEQYYLDHPCPSWADEKQWQKLLGKVSFPNGGISYQGLSVQEIKILEGFTFSSVLEKRSIHRSERKSSMESEKHKLFSEGRKKGSTNKKTNELISYIRALYLTNPRKKAFTLFEEADKKIIGKIKQKTFEGYLTEIKRQLKLDKKT